MARRKLSRRSRRFLRRIQRAGTAYELQEIATAIQLDLDKRLMTYEEAIVLGNQVQQYSEGLPGDQMIYAISDIDAYRRSLELYLDDGVLTKTEQLLLWEERRRLGITDKDHEQLLQRLLTIRKKQGKRVHIQRFSTPSGQSNSKEERGEVGA